MKQSNIHDVGSKNICFYLFLFSLLNFNDSQSVSFFPFITFKNSLHYSLRAARLSLIKIHTMSHIMMPVNIFTIK